MVGGLFFFARGADCPVSRLLDDVVAVDDVIVDFLCARFGLRVVLPSELEPRHVLIRGSFDIFG